MLTFKQFSRRFITICWTTLAIMIILFALIVSISRMLMPLIADYRQDLERLASEELGRPVMVEAIKGEWVGLWPRVHLSGVRMQSKSASAEWLQVADVWLTIDLVSLLTKRQLDTRGVSINGLQLDVHRSKETEYVINGESFRLDQSSPNDQAGLLRWLFTRDRLELQNSRFTYLDKRHSSQPIELSGVNVSLQNSDELHHAYGQFTVPGQRQSSMSFVIDMRGDMLRPQHVVNDFYLQGDVNVSSGMQEWLRPLVNIKQGNVDLRLWGAGSLQRLERVSAEMHASKLAWSITDGQRAKAINEIDELQAKMFWARSVTGWNLDVEDFTLTKQDSIWPQSEIHLTYRESVDFREASLEGAIGFIKLEDVAGLLSGNLPYAMAESKQIRQLDLQGSLQQAKFRIQHDQDGIRSLFFNADFNNLGFKRQQKVPGIRGLDGKITLNRDTGSLQLSSQDTHLDFGDLFKGPLQVRDLKGDIYWQSTDAGLLLSFDELLANNQDLETISRATIIIPPDGASPFIDMSMNFDNGKASSAFKYIPRGIMKKKTVSWLDKAFLEGEVSAGTMVFHGPSANFPFVDKPGSFQVDFDAKGVLFNYAHSWPQLHKVDAHVRFKENSLAVDLHKGSVKNVGIRDSQLKIKSLGKRAVLDMELDFSGPTQQFIDYLYQSPAGKAAADVLTAVSADGKMNNKLTLAIPLGKPQKYRMQGHMQFKGGTVRLAKWQHELEQFKGDLFYSYDGDNYSYQADNLQGKFQDQPAQLFVRTMNNPGQASLVSLEMHARMGLSQLLKDKLPKDQEIFSGDSNWKIALNLQDKDTTLSFESDLIGEEIRLPDDFSKQADQARKAQFNAHLYQSEINQVELVYGDIAKAIFNLSGKKNKAGFSRGTVRFGKGKAILATSDGLVIKGRVRKLDVKQWLALTGDVEGKQYSLDDIALINELDLKCNNFLVGQNKYSNLSIIATRRPTDIFVTVSADEVAGELILPVANTQIAAELNLKYLHLNGTGNKEESVVPNPRNIPAFKLVSNKLFLNGKELGKLTLHASKLVNGVKIDKLELNGQQIAVTGAGSWVFKKSWHESAFSINFKTPAIAEALHLFDFQASIEDGEADAHLQASWSGPPHWFEMKRLNGKLHLSIKKGQLRDVDPGGGRIFGLLSLQSLQRRLFLDFSDLFKKGFSFDMIAGDFNIADGDAYTSNLYVDGPAAHIDIAGRIGLADEDYDEQITVTPKLSSSIPVLGLAAGPQVAIGLYLTEKILRKNIHQMSRIRYTLSGSWDSPKITKIATEEEQDSELADP